MRRIGGLFALAAIAAGLAIVGASPAAACSCIPQSLDEVVHNAPYVFVGTPLSAEPIVTNTFADLAVTFEVSAVLYGAMGPTVEVQTSVQETSCGDGPDWAKPPFDQSEFAVIGRSGPGGVISSNEGNCVAPVTPEILNELLATSLPPPTSTEPMAALIPLRKGWGALAALDSRGELVAWAGGGTPLRVATCPDSPHSVESLPHKLQVRDLSTMRVEVTYDSDINRYAELHCLAYNDGAVKVLHARRPNPDAPITLIRTMGGEREDRLKTGGEAIVLERTNNRAIVLPKAVGTIGAVDLDTFEITPLTDLERFPGLAGALNGDGQLVVVTTNDATADLNSMVGTIDIYSLEAGVATLSTSFSPVLPNGYLQRVSWYEDTIVLELDRARMTRFFRFTPEGVEINRFAIRQGSDGLVVGDVVVSRSSLGHLIAHPLDGSEAATVLTGGPFEASPAVAVLHPPGVITTNPVAPALHAPDSSVDVPATSTVTSETDGFSEEIAAPALASADTPGRLPLWPVAVVVAALAAAAGVGLGVRRWRE